LGDPAIALAMVQGGVKFIADSRLENIQRMRAAGVVTQFVLLRTAPSQAQSVIESVDISLNTELETIEKLSYYANLRGQNHQIILMVEMGDLREGILPVDLSNLIQKILKLPCIQIIGIGCNLACYGGIKPTPQKMDELSGLANAIELEFGLKLEVISGGNSANYEWSETSESDQTGRVNNLRLGESILLGRETLNRRAIPGLCTHAFQLIAEVIESKDKPSLPFGAQDAFGAVPTFVDRGIRRRVILALGRQDILISGLTPVGDLEILGSSSDHMVLDSDRDPIPVGSEVKFNLDYGGLLSAMTSPFIQKQFFR
jgi:ornithine racemase